MLSSHLVHTHQALTEKCNGEIRQQSASQSFRVFIPVDLHRYGIPSHFICKSNSQKNGYTKTANHPYRSWNFSYASQLFDRRKVSARDNESADRVPFDTRAVIVETFAFQMSCKIVSLSNVLVSRHCRLHVDTKFIQL